MNKMLKYLVVAVLFSFSVSGHAEKVSSVLAHQVLTQGEPIASGDTGFDDGNIWLITSLRYAGLIYFCQINFSKSAEQVSYWCYD